MQDSISVLKLFSDVKLEQSLSQKTGKPYTYLKLILQDGYDITLFLERGDIHVLKSLVKNIQIKSA